jgi:hypothetical protein
MDTKIKAEWVAALRSGEYRKGVGRLARIDLDDGVTSYCCLGVLCEISPAVEQVMPEFSDGTRPRYQSLVDPEDSDSALLPSAVLAWSGLESWTGGILGLEKNNPEFFIGSVPDENGNPSEESLGYFSLAGLNDDGFTFDQIADVIEYFL